MKIYSQLIDLSKTAQQTFWVAPNSQFKLGVKLVQDAEFKVMDGESELQSDGEVDGFATYPLQSTSRGENTYIVEADNGQKVAIKQVTTDSTVFEVGGDGGSTPEGNFVKSVNGEYPVNSNVDVSKLKIEDDGWLTGDAIMQSLDNIDDQLALKADLTAIVPVSPSTSAAEDKIAGAKSTAEFVNSSIATNTANFKGTFTSEGDFPAEATNNDYLFFDTTDDEGNRIFKRYKYVAGEGTDGWQYEYTLNNSSFTAAQWASVNSGITAGDVADMAKKSELDANTMTLAGEYEDGEAFNFVVYVKNA